MFLSNTSSFSDMHKLQSDVYVMLHDQKRTFLLYMSNALTNNVEIMTKIISPELMLRQPMQHHECGITCRDTAPRTWNNLPRYCTTNVEKSAEMCAICRNINGFLEEKT